MFELLTIALFVWLLVKTIKLAFRLTWGAAKITAGILMAVAAPLLILFLVMAGGLMLLIPIAILAIAAGIANQCVS